MANKDVLPYSIDDFFKSTSVGSLDKAIGNNLYGFNHTQTPNVVPSNWEHYGFTFFVRPQLNLQTDNIRNIRQLYPMLTNNMTTMQAVVRCLLDPRLQTGFTPRSSGKQGGMQSIPNIFCPLVDAENAFIPILTNNLNSISGWPDMAYSPYSTKEGLYKEVYSLPDGVARNYESYTLDASFRNTKGDPILFLFYVWEMYMAYVREGKLVPYMDYLINNRLDFNTRIYRLVLDKSKRFVTKIFATGAAFPISNPLGAYADFNKEKPFNDQNKDITIRFQCMGFEALDDILIYEFNKVVGIFNGSMRGDPTNSSDMVKVDYQYLTLFKNRGYPHIDPNTNELQWYVPGAMYNNVLSSYLDSKTPTNQDLVEIGD